ncbi:MAG: hypothetical protein K2X38_20410 [Gemmataceae bacterium]|nr:hypothetical protein [Gemmataceae bacterium]
MNVLVGGRRREYSGTVSRGDAIRFVCDLDVKPGGEDDDEPGLRVAASPELIVTPGGKNLLKVRVARTGFTGPVACRLDGDLRGIDAPPFAIAAGETQATVEIAADSSANAGTRLLAVRTSAGTLKADANFQLTVQAVPPELRLGTSPEVIIHPGGSNGIQVRLARSNVPGSVRVRLEGDSRGIAPAEISLGPTENELTLPIQVNASAAIGDRVVKIVATAGEVQAETNMRLRIEELPPQLRLAIPSEIQLHQGGHNELPVRTARDRFTGPVHVRLEGNLSGVSPREFTIPADRDHVEVAIYASEDAVAEARSIRVIADSTAGRAEQSLQLIVAGRPNIAGASWSWRMVFVIGLWTSLLALGLSAALVIGQNRHLDRPWLSWGEFAILATGSLAAGVIAGGTGQSLYGLLAETGLVPEIGFSAGWLLLGCLLGRGVVFFIPNLSVWRATVAGGVGGLLGAAAFIVVSNQQFPELSKALAIRCSCS